MAGAFDADLGSLAFNTAAATTHTLTTSATVAASGKIVLFLMLYATPLSGTPSTAGGGLTWTTVTAAGDNFTLIAAYADAPSGLASGTVITVTHASSGGGAKSALSFTGIATGAANAQYAPTTGGQGANWTMSGLSTTGDGMLVGVSCTLVNGTGTYNTPTGGATELHDIGDAGGPVSLADEYRAVTGAGTYTLTGTARVGTTFNQQLGLAFNAAAGGAAVVKRLAAMGVG